MEWERSGRFVILQDLTPLSMLIVIGGDCIPFKGMGTRDSRLGMMLDDDYIRLRTVTKFKDE